MEDRAKFAAGDSVRLAGRIPRRFDLFKVVGAIPEGFYRVHELEYVSRFGAHKLVGSNLYHESELEPA